MIPRPLAFTLGLLAVMGGCSGRSIVIGGDPSGEGGGAATGGVTAGGAFPNGGVTAGGAFPNGGASIGGTFPAGGSVGTSGAPFGGSSIGGSALGGTGTLTGGTGGSDIGPGGDGNFDPYPFVSWQEGQGYRSACPEWDDVWGFTCWNHQDGVSTSCGLDGSPYCNACSCAVPCVPSVECPKSLSGDEARCLAAPTNAPSCFVTCNPGKGCENGMTCSQHPGTGDFVCVWVSDRTIN